MAEFQEIVWAEGEGRRYGYRMTFRGHSLMLEDGRYDENENCFNQFTDERDGFDNNEYFYLHGDGVKESLQQIVALEELLAVTKKKLQAML